MIKQKKIFFNKFSLFLSVMFLLISSDCYGALEIMNFRHWTAPDHTRIVLDVDDEPLYKIKQNENILVLSFGNASIGKGIPQSITVNKPGIKKMAFHHDDGQNVRIEFILDRYRKVNVFKLKKFQGKPDRIVVDILLEATPGDIKTKETSSTIKKKKIIVIDPGHGGEDPGAVGKKRSYEKDIVLSISREIQKNINRLSGYRSVLTREGDYYVSFNKRLQKARDLQASLFISIHADAARNRSAKGSSVYCLSTGAASNEAAKLLAHNENLSDIFGGDTDIEGSNESNSIIMNMYQTNTINLSKIYAETLIKHLNRVNSMKNEVVQEAPFRVLKLPDIPAVLIETAYISNKDEETLLKKSNFQKSLAMAISTSIKDYFAGSDADSQEKNDMETTVYKVKKGDTLFSIAKKFNTDIDVILKLNNMNMKDTVFIEQQILVPTGKSKNKNLDNKAAELTDKATKSKHEKQSVKYYRVKKGDSLFLIAKDNSITVEELLKANNMKINDPLLYGLKIKIPLKNIDIPDGNDE